VVAEALPFRLQRDPLVVDHPLVQLGQFEPGAAARGDLVAEQVDVGFDRHRLARLGVVEMGRHAGGDDEVGVEADEDEAAAGAQEPRRLGVERRQVGEVLVDETGDDEVIGAAVEPGRADLGLG
jgi:hypothetical protein